MTHRPHTLSFVLTFLAIALFLAPRLHAQRAADRGWYGTITITDTYRYGPTVSGMTTCQIVEENWDGEIRAVIEDHPLDMGEVPATGSTQMVRKWERRSPPPPECRNWEPVCKGVSSVSAGGSGALVAGFMLAAGESYQKPGEFRLVWSVPEGVPGQEGRLEVGAGGCREVKHPASLWPITGTGWITGHYDPQNPDVITGTFTEQRGDHTYVVSLNLRRGAPPEKEKVSVALHGACEGLAVGEAINVTATGTPAGGSFRFWAEPGDAVEVMPLAAAAMVRAVAPGSETLYVEYTAPDGTKAKASRPLTCVRVATLNGGAPLRIGLHDVDGRRVDGVRTVSVEAEPGPAALEYRAADAAILGLAPTSAVLQVQGVRVGRTTVQAYTSCGQPVGAPLDVEVVPCDDEVVAELRRRERMLRGRLDSNRRQQTEVTGDDEFERASREGPKDIANFARKVAELTLAIGGMKAKPTSDVAQFSDAYSWYTAAEDAVNGNYAGSALTSYITSMKNANAKALAGAMKTAYEAAEAARKLAQDLGTAKGAADRLDELERQERETQAELENVWRVLNQVCKREPSGEPHPPSDEVKAEQPPHEPAPPPAPREPWRRTEEGAGKGAEPSARPADEPGDAADPVSEDAPPPSDEVIVEPPPAEPPTTTGPSGVYGTGLCGCTTASANPTIPLPVRLEGMKNCVEGFRLGTLEPLHQELQALEGLFGTLEAIAARPAEEQPQLLVELREEGWGGERRERVTSLFAEIEEYASASCAPVLEDTFRATVESIRVKY